MSQLNRRQFTSLAAGLTAGTILTTSPKRSEAIGPNDKMGVAVVGVNGRGGEHLREFHNDKRVEIRAIVDIDEYVGNQKADMVAGLQGKRPTVYTDMRKAFDSKEIDAISTATPNHWHGAMWYLGDASRQRCIHRKAMCAITSLKVVH